MFEALGKVMRQQVRERQLEIDSLDAVFSDPDLLEERLVVGAAELVWCPHIGLKAVGDQAESRFEVALDLVESQSARAEDALGLGLLSGDPCLFLFEQVDGDGVGVVGLQQLGAFAAQRLEAALLSGYFLGVEVASDLDVIGHVLTDDIETTRFQADDLVVGGYCDLHLVGRQVSLIAAIAALTAEAKHVLVGAAVPFGVGH